MELFTIVLIAFGLTGDTLAVSVSTGLSLTQIRFTQALKIAIVLAVFQSLMPLIGWFLGLQIKELIRDFDHWIAFVLLFAIGGKMIVESLKNEEGEASFNPLQIAVLLGIAIATSIDALVVGVTFAFIETNVLLSVVIIGVLTFLVSMTGVLIGKKTGHLFGRKVEIIGGLILIGIGTKILVEHLYNL